jgi:hypothetical protein
MRMLDSDRDCSVRNLQLYLSPHEAQAFRKELDRLLADPEAVDHSHGIAEDMSREISFSILTERKLQPPHRYTELEMRIFGEK